MGPDAPTEHPDLRTAAQALGAAIVKRLPLMHRKAIEAEYEALRAALAAQATESPPDPGGMVAEVLADYGDDLTDADDRVEAINRVVDALAGSAPNPQGADEPGDRLTDPDPLAFAASVGREHAAERPPRMTGVRDVEAQDRELIEIFGIGADEPGDDDLIELRRLHEAATPGPWAWEMTGDKDNSWGIGIIVDDDENLITGRNEPGENLLVESICEAGANGNPADAELIVAMRNALPGLLAEFERLRAAAPASEDDEATDAMLLVLCENCGHLAAAHPGNGTCGHLMDVKGGTHCGCQRFRSSGEMAAGSPPPTPVPTTALLHKLAEARREYADSGPDDHRSAIAHEAEAFDVAASVIEDPARWRDVIACYAPSWRWRDFDDLLAALLSEPAPPLWTGDTEPPPWVATARRGPAMMWRLIRFAGGPGVDIAIALAIIGGLVWAARHG